MNPCEYSPEYYYELELQLQLQLSGLGWAGLGQSDAGFVSYIDKTWQVLALTTTEIILKKLSMLY